MKASRLASFWILAILLAPFEVPFAVANDVLRIETIAISEDVDSFEVKCTQSSRQLCVSLEEIPFPYRHPMVMSGVGTYPPSILGQAVIAFLDPTDERNGFCLHRPLSVPEGTMKALVAVTYRGASPAIYQLSAECRSGIFGETTRNTVVTRRQNE